TGRRSAGRCTRRRRAGGAVIVLLLLQLVLALRPDLTPGAAIPRNVSQVCAVPWTADRSTDVPTAEWQTVLRRYGLTWEQRTDYLPTLAIPKALGGVYAVENLWPAPKASEWNQAQGLRRALRGPSASDRSAGEGEYGLGRDVADLFCEVRPR